LRLDPFRGSGTTLSRATGRGYRAVRLNDAYRAIYILRKDGSVETVHVEQVTKHDY
jgi:hypothetical protein